MPNIDTDITLNINLSKSEKLALDRAGVSLPDEAHDASSEIWELEGAIELLEEDNKKPPKYMRTAIDILEDIESKMSDIEQDTGIYEVKYIYPEPKKTKKRKK